MTRARAHKRHQDATLPSLGALTPDQALSVPQSSAQRTKKLGSSPHRENTMHVDSYSGVCAVNVAAPSPTRAAAVYGPGLPVGLVDDACAEMNVLKRRLEHAQRCLRRGQSSPETLGFLARKHEVKRLNIALAGWRRLFELLRVSSHEFSKELGSVGSAQSGAIDRSKAQTLHAALSADVLTPSHYRAIVASLHEKVPLPTFLPNDQEAPLAPDEQSVLEDLLNSTEPSVSAILREHLAQGSPPTSLRHLLIGRHATVDSEAPHTTTERAEFDDLTYDIGINRWVPKHSSHTYTARLAQLLEIEIPGVVSGVDTLTTRLVNAATDPLTGVCSPGHDMIANFVQDLRDAASLGDIQLDALLGHTINITFYTKNSGDTPTGFHAQLEAESAALLLDGMGDAHIRTYVASRASAARTEAQSAKELLHARFRELLARFPGKPRLHKRAHAALINLGRAGSTFHEMAKESGVLPSAQTLLTPAVLRTRYAEVQHLKLRFVITDAFDVHVLSDETFTSVLKRFGFPPNHELLAQNRPVLASGYVTIARGAIIALEDDRILVAGSLDDGLPPAHEIFQASGYTIDSAGIALAPPALDWKDYVQHASSVELPDAPSGDVDAVRTALIEAKSRDRARLTCALVRHLLESARADGNNEEEATKKTVRFLSEALGGFRIINAGARAFRLGDLPTDKGEFDDLIVDSNLAHFLVRKVQQ